MIKKKLILIGVLLLTLIVIYKIHVSNTIIPISLNIQLKDGLSCTEPSECAGGYCNNYKCDSSPLILKGGGSAPSSAPSAVPGP